MQLSLHGSWAPNHGAVHVTEHPMLRLNDGIVRCGWHRLQVCVDVRRLCHRHPLIAHELAGWIWCEHSGTLLATYWQWQAHVRPSTHKLYTGSIACGWHCHHWSTGNFGCQRETGAANTKAADPTTIATSSTVPWLGIVWSSTTTSSWCI